MAGTEHISSIHREHTHVETCSYREILTVTLIGSLVVITSTQHETIIVSILSTQTPLNLLHLLLESVRGIIETLEDTSDGRNVIIVGCLALVLSGFDAVAPVYWHSYPLAAALVKLVLGGTVIGYLAHRTGKLFHLGDLKGLPPAAI